MKTGLGLLVTMSLIGGCALRGGGPSAEADFDVAVFGDMPYIDTEENRAVKTAEYMRVLESIDGAGVAFVVHIGDIGLPGQCSDSVYAVRAAEFRAMTRPLVYLFGDNEWTDCATAGYEPLDRLERLRRVFAADERDSGSGHLPLARQRGPASAGGLPENVRWTRAGVQFIGLHLVGSNNNWGTDSMASEEHRQRTSANVAWLRESFALATTAGARGVVVFTHANPLPSSAARAGRPNGYAEVMGELRALATVFARPVALVHGDTHYFRVDMPFADSTGLVLRNVVRAETFGDPNAHWLRLTIHPGPEVFSFRPVIVPGNGHSQ